MNTWHAKAHQLRQAQADILVNILRSLDPDDPRTIQDAKFYGSPAGDEQKLRGVPVVGAQGVGGTIAGTSPLQALMSKQPKEAA